MSRALFMAAVLASIRCNASAPSGLTGWRTPQGIYLSWSVSASGQVGVWRGTEPGSLAMLALLPAGQAGFLDLSAIKSAGYIYALGDERKPGAEITVPAAPRPVRILSGLVTTCSGLVPGGAFPANTQNFFYASKNAHVQYYGYFLLRPFDPSPREARLVWRGPDGQVFSEYSHSITPRRVDLPEGQAGQILLAQAIGLRDALPQNGQQRVPVEPGLYTVEALVDDVPVALTIFYLKEGAAAPKK